MAKGWAVRARPFGSRSPGGANVGGYNVHARMSLLLGLRLTAMSAFWNVD
jgi:hypothetical protein